MVMKNIHILRIFMWLRFICAAALTTVFPILIDAGPRGKTVYGHQNFLRTYSQ